MKIYGTVKNNICKNSFVTLIFKNDNNFFIQKKINPFNFTFKKIEIKSTIEILQIEKGEKYSDNINEYIYGFSDNFKSIKCGTRKELTDYLIYQLDNIDDRIVRLSISKELRLNGLSRDLEGQRDDYFRENNIKVKFLDKKRHLTIDKLSNETKKLLENKLNYYNGLHKKHLGLEWNHIVSTEVSEDSNDIYLDNFKFKLSQVFKHLIKEKTISDLPINLIKKNNAQISYLIENREDHLNSIKTKNDYNEISEYIKMINNE